MEFRGFRGLQEERTDRTVLLAKFQPIWWYTGSESPLWALLWGLSFGPMGPGTLWGPFFGTSSVALFL